MVREKLCAKLACLTLGVSRSGFYAWMRRPEAQRKAENKALVAQIRSIHAESRVRVASRLKSSKNNRI